MSLLFAVAALLAGAPVQAPTPCTADIERSYKLTYQLPDTQARNLLLRDIVTAQNAHHEGDEKTCKETIAEVIQVLRESGTI